MNSLIGIYFQVIRHLLKQGIDWSSKQSLLIILWSFISLVITSSFAGIVVSLIVVPELRKFNSIDEIAESKLLVYNNNGSVIWHKLKNYFHYNISLDNELVKIWKRIEFISDKDKVRIK